MHIARIFTIIIILSTEQGFSVKRMFELFFNRKVKSRTEKLKTTKRRWKKYMCNKAATISIYDTKNDVTAFLTFPCSFDDTHA